MFEIVNVWISDGTG